MVPCPATSQLVFQIFKVAIVTAVVVAIFIYFDAVIFKVFVVLAAIASDCVRSRPSDFTGHYRSYLADRLCFIAVADAEHFFILKVDCFLLFLVDLSISVYDATASRLSRPTCSVKYRVFPCPEAVVV